MLSEFGCRRRHCVAAVIPINPSGKCEVEARHYTNTRGISWVAADRGVRMAFAPRRGCTCTIAPDIAPFRRSSS
jgi:hypothetical protein